MSSPPTPAKKGVRPYPQDASQACFAFTSSAEPTDGVESHHTELEESPQTKNPLAAHLRIKRSALTNSRKTDSNHPRRAPAPWRAATTGLGEYASACARTKLRRSQIRNHSRSWAGIPSSLSPPSSYEKLSGKSGSLRSSCAVPRGRPGANGRFGCSGNGLRPGWLRISARRHRSRPFGTCCCCGSPLSVGVKPFDEKTRTRQAR